MNEVSDTKITIESPCIRQCKINVTENICKGCFRTLDDVQNWTKYSDEQKKIIINDIKRLTKL